VKDIFTPPAADVQADDKVADDRARGCCCFLSLGHQGHYYISNQQVLKNNILNCQI
jgi:hypothetical protein